VAKNDKFFDEQSEASGIKAQIITKYFNSWWRFVLPEAKRRGGRIAYFDLFCGPGRYGNGKPSTPIMVLEKAIAQQELCDHLVTVFNDGSKIYIAQLDTEIAKLPGIEKLTYPPTLLNEKVEKSAEQYFNSTSIVPSFTFIDPFGYKGLTQNLVRGVIKNWGCDCVFFFNYARINAALSANEFVERMSALFGETRASELRDELNRLNVGDREELIVDKLAEVMREVKGTYVRPFWFKKGKSRRTSHLLVFVTKSKAGWYLMNDIMARESWRDEKDIPDYTYYDFPPQTNKLWFAEYTDLKDALPTVFSGRTLTMQQIYEEHCLGRNYWKTNYKDVLLELEAEGKITTPLKKRPAGTFGDKVMVTFP